MLNSLAYLKSCTSCYWFESETEYSTIIRSESLTDDHLTDPLLPKQSAHSPIPTPRLILTPPMSTSNRIKEEEEEEEEESEKESEPILDLNLDVNIDDKKDENEEEDIELEVTRIPSDEDEDEDKITNNPEEHVQDEII